MNKKIMDLIHNRLDIGFVKYGHENIESDGRDFQEEALEEILDCCIYIAAKLIELRNPQPKMVGYEWWKDQDSLAKEEEKDVDSESERINKLIPKDPMSIIKKAGERLRKEMSNLEGDDDGESESK